MAGDLKLAIEIKAVDLATSIIKALKLHIESLAKANKQIANSYKEFRGELAKTTAVLEIYNRAILKPTIVGVKMAATYEKSIIQVRNAFGGNITKIKEYENAIKKAFYTQGRYPMQQYANMAPALARSGFSGEKAGTIMAGMGNLAALYDVGDLNQITDLTVSLFRKMRNSNPKEVIQGLAIAAQNSAGGLLQVLPLFEEYGTILDNLGIKGQTFGNVLGSLSDPAGVQGVIEVAKTWNALGVNFDDLSSAFDKIHESMNAGNPELRRQTQTVLRAMGMSEELIQNIISGKNKEIWTKQTQKLLDHNKAIAATNEAYSNLSLTIKNNLANALRNVSTLWEKAAKKVGLPQLKTISEGLSKFSETKTGKVVGGGMVAGASLAALISVVRTIIAAGSLGKAGGFKGFLKGIFGGGIYTAMGAAEVATTGHITPVAIMNTPLPVTILGFPGGGNIPGGGPSPFPTPFPTGGNAPKNLPPKKFPFPTRNQTLGAAKQLYGAAKQLYVAWAVGASAYNLMNFAGDLSKNVPIDIAGSDLLKRESRALSLGAVNIDLQKNAARDRTRKALRGEIFSERGAGASQWWLGEGGESPGRMLDRMKSEAPKVDVKVEVKVNDEMKKDMQVKQSVRFNRGNYWSNIAPAPITAY